MDDSDLCIEDSSVNIPLSMHTPRINRIATERLLGHFNYDCFYDAVFPLERASDVRLIYAENGRGKTTFLRTIQALCRFTNDSLESLLEIPFKSITIQFEKATLAAIRCNDLVGEYTIHFTHHYDSAHTKKPAASSPGSSWRVTIRDGNFALRPGRGLAWVGREDLDSHREGVRQVAPAVIYIGHDRLASQTHVRPESDRSAALSHHHRGSLSLALERVESMLIRSAFRSVSRDTNAKQVYTAIAKSTLASSKRPDTGSDKSWLLQQIEELRSKAAPYETYGLLSLSQITELRDVISEASSANSRFPVLRQVLEPYLDDFAQESDQIKVAHDKIHTFVSQTNSFLDHKTMEFHLRDRLRIRSGEREIKPEQLSSGEQQLLFLLSTALLATRRPTLFIVDEPEISLGLNWQRKIIPALVECSKFGPVQILAASHSLQVLNYHSDEAIVQPEEIYP